MEKIYTFTKSSLVKKITIAGSVLFVLLGIFSFFQAPIAYAVDVEVDSGFFFKSDIFAGILLILSGLVLGFVAFKAQNKLPLVLKIAGIFYVVFGLLGISHGNSYENLFSLFSMDLATGWLYLIIGAVVTALGFTAKGNSTVTVDVKKQ